MWFWINRLTKNKLIRDSLQQNHERTMNTLLKTAFTRNYSTTKLPRSALIMANSQPSVPRVSKLHRSEASLNHDTLEAHVLMYPYVVRDSLPRHIDRELLDSIKRFDEVCYYTGPNREMYPSLILIDSYKILEDPGELTDDNLQLASVLAWCFEMITTAFIMTDDVLDNQELRWKKLSWYKRPGIGLTAIVDVNQIRTAAYTIFKKYFQNHPCYEGLMNLLVETCYETALGQSHDVNTAIAFNKKRDINLISMETYRTIVKYKSSIIMYKNPPLAAMHLAKLKQIDQLRQCEVMFEKLSIYRQAQNDVWDCFGKYDNLGKIGTDISEGKCTWVSAIALQHATQEQKENFQRNYGKPDLNCQKAILEMYEELDIIQKFKDYKNELIVGLDKDMKKVSNPSIHKLMKLFVDIYVNIDEDFID